MIFIVIFYLMLWASIVLVIKTIIEDCFRDKDLLSLKLSAIPLVVFLILMGLICSVPLVEFLSK